MESTGQIIAQSQRIAAEFLIADLSMALTFLDVANTTSSDETRRRNRQNARSIYDTALHLMARLSPSCEERPLLDARLGELKSRLLQLGYEFGPEAKNPS